MRRLSLFSRKEEEKRIKRAIYSSNFNLLKERGNRVKGSSLISVLETGRRLPEEKKRRIGRVDVS